MYIKEQQTAIKIINHNYNFLAAAQLDSYSVFLHQIKPFMMMIKVTMSIYSQIK